MTSLTPSPRGTELSETRRAIVSILKREGSASISELAGDLGISYESVRQHVRQMRAEGWLEPRLERAETPSVGRPTHHYRLTSAGDHLFPKHYDLLSVEMIDALVDQFGTDGLRRILSHLANARVEQWAPKLDGLSVRETIHALKGIYLEDDPFTKVEENEAGELRLVEHNCPFFNVARKRPALCSLTVSTLTRLLGYRVVREKQFQKGDGKCVFRLLLNRPIDPAAYEFEFED